MKFSYKQIIYLALFMLLNCVCTAFRIPGDFQNEDAAYWRKKGAEHLSKVLKQIKSNDLRAKNVIIFIGDGMGLTSISAGRIFKGQQNGLYGEEETLVFEDFPHTALSKTYNVDKQVPDSAGTATAMFSGAKTRYSVIGMDATCTRTNAEQGKLKTIMDWAQEAGKRTGFVTTTRVTHATPSSLYANIYHRDWECDSEIPQESRGIYKDIARQLVEDEPGKNLNVILAGGLSPMGDLNLEEKSTVRFGGSTETICTRTDGRNLTDEWLNLKSSSSSATNKKGTNHTIVQRKRVLVKTRDDLLKINPDEIDHLMGLFRNNHITYSIARQEGEPSLSEMTKQAIKILDKPDSKGYVLMVEGGRIDMAHHQNYAHAAMVEMIEFDNAVATALNLTKRSDTLIIVTADHSHSLTFNGYPMRGTDILGFANKTSNEAPYETLTYANGPGYWSHRINDSSTISSIFSTWKNVAEISKEERSMPTYRHMAAIPISDETHGGEDVAVYAIGPGAELVRGTFEQNYLAFVMSYSGCFGLAKDTNKLCDTPNYSYSSGSSIYKISQIFINFNSIVVIVIVKLGYEYIFKF